MNAQEVSSVLYVLYVLSLYKGVQIAWEKTGPMTELYTTVVYYDVEHKVAYMYFCFLAGLLELFMHSQCPPDAKTESLLILYVAL